MASQVGGYALAVLLLIGGAASMLVAFARTAQPHLDLGESARNWGRLLSARPADAEVSLSTPFGYQARLNHRRGWYRDQAGQVVRARASRVHVAPDQIARLGYSDSWNGLRVLDSSAFCLQGSDASETVDFLSRSGRFELVYNDDRFRSRDGYPMNCHLAVHFWVSLSLSDVRLIDRLLDQMPSLQRDIEQRVAGLLREDFGAREYRQSFYDVPVIVQRLNAAWEHDDDLAELRQMLEVRFAALLIKPREEAERRFLATPGAGEEQLRDRIHRVQEELKQETRYWNARRDDLRTTLAHALDELVVHPPKAIGESLEGLKATVGQMGSGAHVVDSVEGMFLGGRRALHHGANKIVDGLQLLRELIEDLAAEDARLRAALAPAPQKPEADPAGAPSIVRLPEAGVAHADPPGSSQREKHQAAGVRL